MPYTATNDYAGLVETTPLGSESPDILDDALRETRKVAKTVNANGHSSKGVHKFAVWKLLTASATGGMAAGQWNRLPLATINDPASILTAGTHTSSIRLAAGIYLVRFWCQGYFCDDFQCRVAETTGNTATPSAATVITDLVGGNAFSNNSAAYASAVSIGSGIYTADGIKSLCLDERHSTGTAASNIARVAPSGQAGAIAGIEFFQLAAAL